MITFFDDAGVLTATVADAWADAVAASAGRSYRVALSGGRSAARLFAEWAARVDARGIDVSQCEFFWADERCVPPDHPDSNYLLAHEALFAPLGIAAGRIHRIPGENGPVAAAAAASAELRAVSGIAGETLPVLDLVLLGMGEDGHVASLFPGDDAAFADAHSLFRPVHNSPKPPPQRVTLGQAVITAAREVWVVVTGEGKEAPLREALSGTGTHPLANILRQRQETRLFSTTRIASAP